MHKKYNFLAVNVSSLHTLSYLQYHWSEGLCACCKSVLLFLICHGCKVTLTCTLPWPPSWLVQIKAVCIWNPGPFVPLATLFIPLRSSQRPLELQISLSLSLPFFNHVPHCWLETWTLCEGFSNEWVNSISVGLAFF